jgi:hypothetical protein
MEEQGVVAVLDQAITQEPCRECLKAVGAVQDVGPATFSKQLCESVGESVDRGGQFRRRALGSRGIPIPGRSIAGFPCKISRAPRGCMGSPFERALKGGGLFVHGGIDEIAERSRAG